MTGHVSQRITKVVSVSLAEVLEHFDIDLSKYRATSVGLGMATHEENTTLEISLVEIPKAHQRNR